MEETVDCNTISAEEFQAGNWTPVLYKAYVPQSACSQKPLSQPNATFEAANPNTGKIPCVEAAAAVKGKMPAHLPPATEETQIIVQRSNQLPPLPPNAVRVVVCEVNCDFEMSQRLDS
ncbi:hypothetical protein MRX96_020531 [Rhipicephalus microplus]